MKSKKEQKRTKFLIIGISAILILVIIFGLLYFTDILKNKSQRNFQPGQMLNDSPRGNLPLDESQINGVISFFDNDPTSEEVYNYCEGNRESCFYYCTKINLDNEFCTEIMSTPRMNGTKIPLGEIPQ